MSAKRPRARRSRMCRSVSSYGAAGAAPPASRPSSAASRSSSRAVMEGFCPVKAVRIHEHDGRISVVGEHFDGTHAELIALPASAVYALPDELGFEEAAAFPLVFETAYRMLVTKARLEPGEWVLVWGIGGGVATAALAIAKALGGRVIVTSRSEAKLERATELGADAAVPTG